MIEQFILERRYLKNVSPKTEAWYRDSFKAFKGCETEAEIKQRIVELRQRGVSAISINTWVRCINAYLNWKGAGYKINKLKEDSKILQTLSAQDIRAILAYKPIGVNLRRAHAIALTILDTGLRAAEVLSLTKESVDMDNLVLKVQGKGGKHRLVPFSAELRKVLYRYLINLKAPVRVTPVMFGTKNNTKLSVRNFERDLKVLGKKLGITGIRFSPHTLRHTFAVSYLRAGGNLEYLRRILGHSNLSTTQKYLRSLGVADLGLVHNQLSPLCKSGGLQ